MKRFLVILSAFVLALLTFQTASVKAAPLAAPSGSVGCDTKLNLVVVWSGGSGNEGSVRIDYGGATVFFSSASGSYLIGPGPMAITLQVDRSTLVNGTYTCLPGEEESPDDGPGVPDGFVLRTIVCTIPVYTQPGGVPVGSDKLLAGQTWYVDPVSVKGPDGKNWTEVFVSGDEDVFIPTVCVGKAPIK